MLSFHRITRTLSSVNSRHKMTRPAMFRKVFIDTNLDLEV